MSVKKIVTKQYRDIVNRAARKLDGLILPQEGWLRTVRNSLNMSGAQLARRMSVTRALISNTEKAELSGSVTLKSIRQMAEEMNCRFVYAIVPEHDIEDVIAKRARDKATKQVKAATTHMALEDQTLSGEKMEFEIDRLAKEIVEKMDSKLWNDEWQIYLFTLMVQPLDPDEIVGLKVKHVTTRGELDQLEQANIQDA